MLCSWKFFICSFSKILFLGKELKICDQKYFQKRREIVAILDKLKPFLVHSFVLFSNRVIVDLNTDY